VRRGQETGAHFKQDRVGSNGNRRGLIDPIRAGFWRTRQTGSCREHPLPQVARSIDPRRILAHPFSTIVSAAGIPKGDLVIDSAPESVAPPATALLWHRYLEVACPIVLRGSTSLRTATDRSRLLHAPALLLALEASIVIGGGGPKESQSACGQGWRSGRCFCWVPFGRSPSPRAPQTNEAMPLSRRHRPKPIRT